MKRLIWLLILIAAGYGVWRFYPELERHARNLTQQQPAAPAPADPTDLIANGVLGNARSRQAARAASPIAAGDAASLTEKELAARYPKMQFEPIESLVGNWKKIPPSAFPRPITLKSPATLTLNNGVGTSTLEAGRKVVALAATPDGNLIIAPSQDAVMRGTVAMKSTDFQSVMVAVYEDFKKRKNAEVEKLRASARLEIERKSTPSNSAISTNSSTSTTTPAGSESTPPAATLATIGPRPEQRDDLTVPAVEKSIATRQQSGKLSEPPAGAALGWSPLRWTEIEGEPYWAVNVRYTARTIFGQFPTEAMALMRHGKVEKWIYAGTGEPLP